MKVEEIESMLKDNKFDLNDIQILLDELAYNYDMVEELEEELAQYKEDTNEYAKMYNEFNRNLPEYSLKITNLEKEIQKLDEKQERLQGRISKKDVEKRNDYEQQLQDLKEKYQFSKNNRIDSRQGYNESKAKYDKLLEEQKIEETKKQFEDYANKLENICKYCLKKIKENDDEIIAKWKIMNENNYSPQQVMGAMDDLKLTYEEKNEINKHLLEVVEMISKSEEYKNTIGKDLINELQEEIAKEMEIKEKTVETVEPEVIEEEKNVETVEPEVTEEEKTVETVEPEVTEEEKSVETVEPETIEEEKTVETVEPEVTEEEKTVETVEPEVIEEEKSVETVEPETIEEEKSVETVEPETIEEEKSVETVEPETIEEEKSVETVEPETKDIIPGQNYWEMQYPKINEVTAYEKKLPEDAINYHDLAKEGPLFRDEERIDVNYDYMTYQNAENLGHSTKGVLANNKIVNIEYAPEGLLKKVQYNILKKALKPEKFEEWCQSKAENQNKTK